MNYLIKKDFFINSLNRRYTIDFSCGAVNVTLYKRSSSRVMYADVTVVVKRVPGEAIPFNRLTSVSLEREREQHVTINCRVRIFRTRSTTPFNGTCALKRGAA